LLTITVDWTAVDEFHKLALYVFPLLSPSSPPFLLHTISGSYTNQASRENGGRDNGAPGIRDEMSRYPYYTAFTYDIEGNNIEAVCAPREKRTDR
jgi:hypothetical protein